MPEESSLEYIRPMEREKKEIFIHYNLEKFNRAPLAGANIAKLNQLCGEAGIPRSEAKFFAISPKEGGENIGEHNIVEVKSFEQLLSEGELMVADGMLADNYVSYPSSENAACYLASIHHIRTMEEFDTLLPQYRHRLEFRSDDDERRLEDVTKNFYAEVMLFRPLPISLEVIDSMLDDALRQLSDLDVLPPPEWRDEVKDYLASVMRNNLQDDIPTTIEDIEKKIKEEVEDQLHK